MGATGVDAPDQGQDRGGGTEFSCPYKPFKGHLFNYPSVMLRAQYGVALLDKA